MKPSINPYASPPADSDESGGEFHDTPASVKADIDLLTYEAGRALPWLLVMLVILGVLTTVFLVGSIFAMAQDRWMGLTMVITTLLLGLFFFSLLSIRGGILSLQSFRQVETLTRLLLRVRTLFAVLAIFAALGLLLQAASFVMTMFFVVRGP